MQIIWAQRDDAAVLAQVFFDAVRHGPSPYTDAQRWAWVPHVPDPDSFADRFAAQYVAAVQMNGALVGFMTLDDAGYIDLAYILHTHRGQGAFRMLFEALEAVAKERVLPRLWTHASLTAQPAFQAMGFSVIQHETVTRAGHELGRAEMEKRLT